ncbi:MAG: FAD-dependent oxidoreductase [Acidobacteriota bacterium]
MSRSPISRRDWIKTAGVAAIGASLGARCAGRKGAAFKHAKVKVSPERVIRTVAGLRPFRGTGFRVETEKLDGKIVIHNYGHGGGGVTLSWGTSHLAMEEAVKTGESTCAVVGCGAVGLATARLLQRRGFDVAIYTRDLPPHTTSNVACASWYPAEGVDPNKRTPEWTDQFIRAARLAYRYFQDLVGDYYGIRWYPSYTLSDEPLEEGGTGTVESTIQDLFPELADLEPRQHPFGYRYCRRTWQMMIEPPVYLNAVLRDFRLAGGKVVRRELADLGDLLSLPEPVILNCTGLGARELFNDEELMPIKGQLTILLPQPEIDYLFVAGGLYMMPRKDGVLLGGTHERGEWSLEPNPAEAQRVMNGHIEFFEKMA